MFVHCDEEKLHSRDFSINGLIWVNNDQDNGPATADSPYASEVLPPNSPDWQSDSIVSVRDLEDWTRLWIYTKGLNTAIKNGSILVGLKWKNVTGTPGIKIALATDSDGGTEYLTDSTMTAANAQKVAALLTSYNNSSQTNIQASSSPNADFIFNSSVWSNLSESAPKTHFIFEATGRGQGQLEIVFLNSTGTTKIGEGGNLWLDLRDIKEMYQREMSMPVPNKPYNYASTPPTVTIAPFPGTSNPNGNSGTFVADPTEDTAHPAYIVFVHGYNMTAIGSTNYAESMFKRLWWRGYKGRFAAFRWNTYGNGTVVNGFGINGGAIGTYNDSEFVAWHSGTALKQFVQSLPSSYAIDVVSHSMGSIVVGEAIEEGMPFTHYAILHGAASASCYSTSSQIFSTTNPSITGSPDTSSDPAATALAYRFDFKDINSSAHPVVNFYDDGDTVVGVIWEANNYIFKPQAINPQTSLRSDYYYYNPLDGSGQKLGFEHDVPSAPSFSHRNLTDFGEARAYADFSLTATIGSLDTTTYGAISSSVNDNSFGNHHSNEFNWSIQQLKTFYNALLNSFRLTPNP